jgi:hypothetical protein
MGTTYNAILETALTGARKSMLHRDTSSEFGQLSDKRVENPHVVPVGAGRAPADRADTVFWQLPHNLGRPQSIQALIPLNEGLTQLCMKLE